MRGATSRLKIIRIEDDRTRRFDDVVVKERPVTILLNDSEVATLMCTPKNLDRLSVGFLFTEGLVRNRKDIKKVLADEKDGVVWVETRKPAGLPQNPGAKRYITTGCGRGLTFVDPTHERTTLGTRSKSRFPIGPLRLLMAEFLRKSKLFRLTGGVHSAAICNLKGILVHAEDIGRHSAIDRVVGECVLRGIPTKDKILITTGRISSDIVVKAARGSAAVIISKSAPTDLAVELASDFGITLVGFARGTRMNVYSNAWRIVTKRDFTGKTRK